MQWFCLVFVIGVIFLGVEGNECSPKPGAKFPSASQCCKKEKKIPEVMKKNIPKCSAKVPPPRGKSDPDDIIYHVVCTAECIFEESNLLTTDGQIDIPALKKLMMETYPNEKNVSTNIDRCQSAVASRVDPSAECKSGAYEMEECLRRNCFLHCPKELWTSSKECDDLRKKVEMCPSFPLLVTDKP